MLCRFPHTRVFCVCVCVCVLLCGLHLQVPVWVSRYGGVCAMALLPHTQYAGARARADGETRDSLYEGAWFAFNIAKCATALVRSCLLPYCPIALLLQILQGIVGPCVCVFVCFSFLRCSCRGALPLCLLFCEGWCVRVCVYVCLPNVCMRHCTGAVWVWVWVSLSLSLSGLGLSSFAQFTIIITATGIPLFVIQCCACGCARFSCCLFGICRLSNPLSHSGTRALVALGPLPTLVHCINNMVRSLIPSLLWDSGALVLFLPLLPVPPFPYIKGIKSFSLSCKFVFLSSTLFIFPPTPQQDIDLFP